MARRSLKIRAVERDGPVSVATVVRILRRTVKLLSELDRSIGGTSTPSTRWGLLSASKQSPLTVEIGEIETDDQAVSGMALDRFVDGIIALDQHAAAPDYYTEPCLEAAKSLVGVLSGELSKIEFAVGDRDFVSPTQHVAANVDDIIGREARYYAEWTTLEGALEKVDVHNKTTFSLFEFLHGWEVSCDFPEDMLDEVGDYLRQRVAVYGETRYDRRMDRPVAITVEKMDRLRSRSELPTLADLSGIDITDGDSSEDFVRRLRDG